MTVEQPVETKRSRRMLVWLIAVPAALLLLALAGANWKVFHLAYCKRLMGSSNHEDRNRGVMLVLEKHVSKGMPLEEVRARLAPVELSREPAPDREKEAEETARALKSLGTLSAERIQAITAEVKARPLPPLDLHCVTLPYGSGGRRTVLLYFKEGRFQKHQLSTIIHEAVEISDHFGESVKDK